ncbi:D-alanyl-D-alanine carboxypeptidase/D-alanyl-D-alanine endopeptidase [Marinobacter daqiaonensis]|nr:D-alanyl-D-alanine carboxypeptidase/D-alanyl-D-alanine-endopeptidase [Marinobacter daqiaonensis]
MRQHRFLGSTFRALTRTVGMALISAGLVTTLASAASAASTEPRLWGGQVRVFAEQSLEDQKGLSVAAIPLNGPGIEQFINADTQMSPGSIMKVLTTYAGLELLGPNHRWTTRFVTDGLLAGDTLKGDLYIEFGGDPKLTMERIWSALRDIRGMGVRTIDGDLVLDGHVFLLPEGLPTFHDNGNNPYRPFLVEPSAVLTNFNLLHFQARSDERGVRSWVSPALPSVTVDNRITATREGPCPSRNALSWTPAFDNQGRVTVRVEGKLPRGCQASTYLSMLPHDRYSAELILSLWQEMGGTVTGGWRHGITPPEGRLIATTISPDLVDMVRDINKWSSNVMARQLLLSLGASSRHPGDNDDRVSGIRAIYDWLEDKGVDTQGMVIDNGSGLSRHARLTARQVSQILTHAWQSPFGSDLMTSMPLTAMDGTMARRLRNLGMEGMGRIKTGLLQDVRSVAGFTRDANNTTWAVVGIVNHSPAWQGQSLLDKVLHSLHRNPPTGTALSKAN